MSMNRRDTLMMLLAAGLIGLPRASFALDEPFPISEAEISQGIRMLNADVADLYDRVPVGTEVVVLQGSSPLVAEEAPPAKRKRKSLFQ